MLLFLSLSLIYFYFFLSSSISISSIDLIYMFYFSTSFISHLYVFIIINPSNIKPWIWIPIRTAQTLAMLEFFEVGSLLPSSRFASVRLLGFGMPLAKGIFRRRDHLKHSHTIWGKMVKYSPNFITVQFEPVTSLLEGLPGKDHLTRAISLYFNYPLVHGFIHIPNDEYAIQLAVATQPVLAEILVDETYEMFDGKSVFKGKCRGQTSYHAVCITGYGVSEDSLEHWTAQDTKGPKWFKKGFIKIEKNNKFGKSRCNIAEYCLIPLIRGLNPPKLANALKAGLYFPEFYQSLETRKRSYHGRKVPFWTMEDETIGLPEARMRAGLKNTTRYMEVERALSLTDYRHNIISPDELKNIFKEWSFNKTVEEKEKKFLVFQQHFWKGAPDKWRLVRARGPAVGLPIEDDMGNSEVGRNALGAGRIFAQGAKLVDLALASGKIFEDEGFNYIKESFATNTLHLIGLMSDGGVHSRLDLLQLLLRGASQSGAKRIRVHVLTDGRDVLDGSSVGFAETLEAELSDLRSKGIDAQVASGGGHMHVTMDRYENDWEVVKRGWDAQVLGEAPHKFKNTVEAIKTLREVPGANDQYLPPFVIVDDSGKPVGPVVDGDAVVTFNFRADRMTMLAQALEYEKFDKFDRVRVLKIRYAGMLQYDGELKLPSHYLVSPPLIDRTSGEYLVHNGVRTFDCSETVKFGHVTFFWNRNRSGYFNSEMEEYVEIPSDSGITFNVQPLMKALEIGEKARDAILSGKFDQVRVNIPSGDMVGDVEEATVLACKAADEAVKMIIDAVEQVGGIFVVTADHGNAQDMVKRNRKGEPILNSHTLQSVPIAIGGPGLAAVLQGCAKWRA